MNNLIVQQVMRPVSITNSQLTLLHYMQPIKLSKSSWSAQFYMRIAKKIHLYNDTMNKMMISI